MPSRNTIEIIIDGKDNASDKVEGFASKLGSLGKAAAVGVAGLVGAIGGVGAAAFELARQAAPIEGVQRAFEGLAEASGKTADEMIAALKRGSLGMATEADLMMSYNKATQLVGNEFANQLPDAMQYLSKVAAATGQDMGYMIDSLVVGVGRLSPMILDNLGIQVNLTEANEAYAASVGKSVSELTKSEQQTAMMNLVLEKLKNNTAAMPDITDNAATKWAQFQTKMADSKNKLGLRLLPFFEAVIDLMNRFMDTIAPLTEAITNNLFYGFRTLIGVLGNMESILARGGIADGFMYIVNAFLQMLGLVGREELSPIAVTIRDSVVTPIKAIQDILKQVIPTLQTVFAEFIMFLVNRAAPAFFVVIDAIGVLINSALIVITDVITNTVIPVVIQFIGIFGQIADFFVTTIIPALVTFGQSMISVVGGALGVVGDLISTIVMPAVQQFIGIFEQVAEFFVTNVIPAVVSFAGIIVNIAQAVLPIIGAVINDIVLPAIQLFVTIVQDIWNAVAPALVNFFDWFITNGLPPIVDFIQNVVIPAVASFIDGLAVIWEKISPGLTSLATWFIEDVLPSIVDFINNTVIPVVSEIIRIISEIWMVVAPALGDLAAWFLEDALPGIVAFINNTVVPAVQAIIDILSTIWAVASPYLEDFKTGISSIFNWIKDNVIQPIVNTIQGVLDKIGELKNAVGGGLSSYQGAAQNAATAASLVSSGQVTPGQFFNALGNAISSQFSGHAIGLPYVPEDGLYRLHKGERVQTAAENQNNQASGGAITINFEGGSAPANQSQANDVGHMVIGALRAQGMNI